MAFAVTQRAFRFYNDDGDLSTATAVAAQNTNITLTDGGGNKQYHLLIGTQETGGTSGATTDDWQLQYSKNGGTWTNVTTTSSNVKAFDSANLVDLDVISAAGFRLTGGTGSPSNGELSETGEVVNRNLASTRHSELLWTIETIDADLAATDTLDFRFLYNGATTVVTYSVTPRITNQSTAIIGTTSKTLGTLTSSSASVLRLAGTSSKTLTAVTCSSSGTGGGITGTLAKTLGSLLSSSASGLHLVGYLPSNGNLVTNGTFDTDISGWTAAPAGTAEALGGRLRVAQDVGGGGFVKRNITVEVGKSYRFTTEVYVSPEATADLALVRLGTSDGGTQYFNSVISTSGTHTFDFTATSTSLWVRLASAQYFGNYVEFDNVGLREAFPLGVLTSTASASLKITGSVSKSLGTLTSVSDSDLKIGASASKTLETLTLSSDGGAPTIFADVAVTLGSLTSTSAGVLPLNGGLSKTLENLISSGEGDNLNRGYLSKTLEVLIGSSSSAIRIGATSSSTLEALSSTAAGKLPLVGTINETLDTLTCSSTSSAVIGTVSVILDSLTLEGDSRFVKYSLRRGPSLGEPLNQYKAHKFIVSGGRGAYRA